MNQVLGEVHSVVDAQQNDMQNPTQHDLITFTPPPRQNVNPPPVVEKHTSEPNKQRSTRKRKIRNEWQLNQRQFEQQNRSQEISHILLQESVVPELFNIGEEPSVSYLQGTEFLRRTIGYVPDVRKQDT